MAENKLRKHYRDKFRRKFNIKARNLPKFETEEEYETYFRKVKFEQEQQDYYFEQLVENNLLPDEGDMALKEIERLYYMVGNIDGTDSPMYNGLEKVLRKFKRMDKALRKRLLRNSGAEAIEAVQAIRILLYSPDADLNKRNESGILVLQKILSGGEVMSMDEVMSFFSNNDNIDT